jgi:hypothetical protein
LCLIPQKPSKEELWELTIYAHRPLRLPRMRWSIDRRIPTVRARPRSRFRQVRHAGRVHDSVSAEHHRSSATISAPSSLLRLSWYGPSQLASGPFLFIGPSNSKTPSGRDAGRGPQRAVVGEERFARPLAEHTSSPRPAMIKLRRPEVVNKKRAAATGSNLAAR